MGDMLPFWSTGHIPSARTLSKYGLSLIDWIEIFNRQKGRCGICKKPLTKRINIDHEHVKNWAKMPPEKRKQYVRGLCCFFCNRHVLFRGATSEKMWDAYQYLRAYEVRIKES